MSAEPLPTIPKYTIQEKLKVFNEIWAVMKMRPLTEKEFQDELKEHPNLLESYYLQEQVAKKYRDNPQ